MRQLQRVAVLRGGREDIALGADVADERHDHLLADGVDGRVGDLREQLFEVVEERLRLVGEAGKRRVDAHGAEGLFAVGGHGSHQRANVFVGVAKCPLAADDGGMVRAVNLEGFGKLVERDLVFFEPLAVRLHAGKLGFQFVVGDDAAFEQVDQEHLAGLQTTLQADILGLDGEHAGF